MLKIYCFIVQMGSNPYFEKKSTRDKTPTPFFREKTPALVRAIQQIFDDLESKDGSWGSDKIVEYYDTYENGINDRG